MQVWAIILGTVVGVSVVAGVVCLDRASIRRRVLACGGKDVRILGPFPTWGFDARMDRRRYGVLYTDANGRARDVAVFVSFGYMKIDGAESL